MTASQLSPLDQSMSEVTSPAELDATAAPPDARDGDRFHLPSARRRLCGPLAARGRAAVRQPREQGHGAGALLRRAGESRDRRRTDSSLSLLSGPLGALDARAGGTQSDSQSSVPVLGRALRDHGLAGRRPACATDALRHRSCPLAISSRPDGGGRGADLRCPAGDDQPRGRICSGAVGKRGSSRSCVPRLERANLLVANSSCTAAEIKALSGRDAVVLPFGSTVRASSAGTTAHGVPRILFTGRLIQRKGVEYLLQAVPQILAKRPAEFVITGDGDQRSGWNISLAL